MKPPINPIQHKYAYAFPAMFEYKAGSVIVANGQAIVLKENTVDANYGMTLRDYFAAKALSGLISNMTYGGELKRIFDANEKIAKEEGRETESPQEYIGRLAYAFADAMLKERKS